MGHRDRQLGEINKVDTNKTPNFYLRMCQHARTYTYACMPTLAGMNTISRKKILLVFENTDSHFGILCQFLRRLSYAVSYRGGGSDLSVKSTKEVLPRSW